MPISRNIIAGSLAGAALLLSAGAAMATPGQATGSVNVRSGPGTSYGIVDNLQPGENVDVQQCRGSWCYVEHSGPDGWVSANFLTTGESDDAPPPVYYDDQPPPVYYDEPEYLPPPVYYSSPGYGYGRPYYGHHHYRRPPGSWAGPPKGWQPPPHLHNHNPGVSNPGSWQHRGTSPQGGGAFRAQPRPQGQPGNACAIDPASCQGGGRGSWQHK